MQKMTCASGTVWETPYVNGKKHGVEKRKRDDGKVYQEVLYTKGIVKKNGGKSSKNPVPYRDPPRPYPPLKRFQKKGH